MQIILLSGGSGKRLWPLSNNTRSKQFIKLLSAPNGEVESMVQRVVRQLRESNVCDSVTMATSISQHDSIINQLGENVSVVTEPERRDTFPAIALATSYLAYEKGCNNDEVVVIMPCDTFTDAGYFKAIAKMSEAVSKDVAELVLMGIKPTYPSSKFGYVVPKDGNKESDVYTVLRFTEKPDAQTAEQLISEGAFWNGGVFAFRLGYMMDIVKKYTSYKSFEEVRAYYTDFPKISFDYEVAEKAGSVAVVPFDGEWKDLGTWNALCGELKNPAIGNAIIDDSSENTQVVNELSIPIMCVGTKNLIVAASNDGILISDKEKSEGIKSLADQIQGRPMYEERRWGEYKVIDFVEFADGHKALTKQLIIKAGKNISYQVHHHRDEVWTFIEGEGRLVLDGVETIVKRGDTICIKKGVKHAVRAITDLMFIEVQSGDLLVEEDIERFGWNW